MYESAYSHIPAKGEIKGHLQHLHFDTPITQASTRGVRGREAATGRCQRSAFCSSQGTKSPLHSRSTSHQQSL